MLTLSKYSPALGLAATILGLVDLLSRLKDAELGNMGFGMAVALSATFYGIIVANMVFAPLSEHILSAGETDHKAREMILDGILALVDKKHPLVVGEIVNSHLPLRFRIAFGSQNFADAGTGVDNEAAA
jgi:chemotaxis protein MotA